MALSVQQMGFKDYVSMSNICNTLICHRVWEIHLVDMMKRYSDKYFLRAADILVADGRDPQVMMRCSVAPAAFYVA